MRASTLTHCATLLVLAALSAQRCVGCPSWTISTSASPQAIPRDHYTSSTVTATVTQNGQPKGGVIVTFSVSSFGEFTDGTTTAKAVATNSQGLASVDVRSSSAGAIQAITTVTASVTGAQASADLTLRAILISLTKTKSKLIVAVQPAQTDTITATVTDTDGVACGGNLTFSTTYGSFSGSGTQTQVSPLDTSGHCSVTLRTDPTTTGGVTADVVGRIDGVAGSTSMPFHRATVKSTIGYHQLRVNYDQCTANVLVADPQDGNSGVDGVSVEFAWSYPPSGSKTWSCLTGGGGTASDSLGVQGSQGTGWFQARSSGTYQTEQPLSWHTNDWFLDSVKVTQDSDGKKAIYAGTFGSGNWEVTVGSNGRISVGWGRKQ